MRKRTSSTREARRRAYMREFRKNIAYYEAHKQQLLKKYRNKFIAVAGEQVIDADTNRIALLGRVFHAIGNDPVFITEVLRHPRVYRVPSLALFNKPKNA
ncbi:MAG: hypothetical protein HY961_02465 [Ignavibacteriae bacterium]|nr:hypothetical protein [Ignavibacteriota bacterium]